MDIQTPRFVVEDVAVQDEAVRTATVLITRRGRIDRRQVRSSRHEDQSDIENRRRLMNLLTGLDQDVEIVIAGNIVPDKPPDVSVVAA